MGGRAWLPRSGTWGCSDTGGRTDPQAASRLPCTGTSRTPPGRPSTPTGTGCRPRFRGIENLPVARDVVRLARLGPAVPAGRGPGAVLCPSNRRYQGDSIEATVRSEWLGSERYDGSAVHQLQVADYTGHVCRMASEWEGLMLEAVDEQLGRLIRAARWADPREYVLLVTADHGQCPLPDDAGGVRLDPIELARGDRRRVRRTA